LEWLTIVWMAVEAVVTDGANGTQLSLTAFGLDSVIELASSGVLQRQRPIDNLV
jgi:hypothetical protein